MSRLIGNVRQIGIVTRDADATMTYWASKLGVGPFFVFPEFQFDRYRYYGEPASSPVLRVGVGHSGPLQVEVIQQLNDAPSVYWDFLSGGRDGVQHVSSWPETAEEYELIHANLLAQGFDVAQEGSVEGYDLRCAYFTRGRGLAAMPFLEISEAMKVPLIRERFAEFERLNAGWNGPNPIRPIS